MRIRGLLFLTLAFFMLAAPAYAALAPLPGDAGLLPSTGKYVVEVMKDGKWVEAAVIGANRHMNEMHADISRITKGMKTVSVRVKAIGGGLAHMDAITLGGMPPGRILGDVVFSDKLMRRDLDVADITGKTVEVEFNKPSGDLLIVTGRIEPDVISKTPFLFPLANLYKGINSDSRFYTYDLNGPKSSKPFFAEMSYSGSGHPDGVTYGWVTHDKDNMYVGIDFTGDNTMDGEADYTKVFVKTEDGVKEFKVTAVDNKWGEAFFAYTDKVPYQHKVYQFAIPMKEIAQKDTKTFELAFAAYGTDNPNNGAQYSPTSAYDPVRQRHFVVFREYQSGTQKDVVGRFYDNVGQQVGPDILISNNAFEIDAIPAHVAYDSNNNRFLVVWKDEPSADINGQFVNAVDGSLLFNTVGENFTITNAPTSWPSEPDVSFDSAGDRFLVAWGDDRNATNDIYGQFVNSLDGSLLFNTVGENFAISNETSWQSEPAVSYDSTGDRFLVVWEDARNANGDIYGQFVDASDGSLVFNAMDVNFPISNEGNTQELVDLAYDATGNRFLAVWADHRSGIFLDIYGQLVDASTGLLLINSVGQNLLITDNLFGQYTPAVASTGYGAYLVVWEDNRDNFRNEIYGQAIDASDASLIDTASDTNLFILNATDGVFQPALSHDPGNDRFLVSAHWEDGSSNRGIVAIVYPEVEGGGGDGDDDGGGGGGCFIATAAYGSYSDSNVMALREFRDEHLMTNALGRKFVDAYYAYSPPVAEYIASHGALRVATRMALAPVVYSVQHPMLIGFVFTATILGAGVGMRRRKKRS